MLGRAKSDDLVKRGLVRLNKAYPESVFVEAGIDVEYHATRSESRPDGIYVFKEPWVPDWVGRMVKDTFTPEQVEQVLSLAQGSEMEKDAAISMGLLADGAGDV